MDNLLIDSLAQQFIDGFAAHPKHALLIDGEAGVGTFTVAHAIASRLTKRPESITVVQPEKGTIAIETVRGLYMATKSSRASAQVIIIDDAEAMGRDAQNALLKLLEEPPKQVYFILTTHSSQLMLNTIRSRTEHITLRRITREASLAFVKDRGVTEPAEQAKLLFLASGKPAELHRLVDDAEYYAACGERMGDARKFIEGDSYDRLILLKKYATDRTVAESLLRMIGQLLSYSLYRTVTDGTVRGLDAVTDALEAIRQNGNLRAQLLLLSDRLS